MPTGGKIMKEIKITMKELKQIVDKYFFDGQPERLSEEALYNNQEEIRLEEIHFPNE